MKDRKSRPIPTLSLTKWEGKKGFGTQEWMDRITKRHGSTKPELLENRRKMLTVRLARIEETERKVNQVRKLFKADAQTRQTEVLEKIKEAKAALSANPADIARSNDLTQWENAQRMLVRDFDLQMLNFDLYMANLNKYAADIEIGCLLIDHLAIRFRVKDKKTGEIGYMRRSATDYLDEMSRDMEYLADQMSNIVNAPDDEDGKDEEEEIPEADREEMFTKEDEKKIEEAKKKKDDAE